MASSMARTITSGFASARPISNRHAQSDLLGGSAAVHHATMPPISPGPPGTRRFGHEVRQRVARTILAGSLSTLTVLPVTAQVDPSPPAGTAVVTVVPGSLYAARGTHRALFGSGYRDLWTTPIEVSVANLSTLAGGVTPNRLGGGMTTRTLHLDGADGRRYVFRSVDKSPVEFEDFAGSLLENIIQDQVSSFHPTGAPVVSALLDAVGVLHTDPAYVVVPDHPRLGEFRAEFAGLLVLVEERPDDGPAGAAGFAGSSRIVQTDDLFDALEENPDHRVDIDELLRARLVDLLVGDRDRSHNNHLWAAFDAADGSTLWRVIPRDRDQAFVRFDGLFKDLARRYDRRLVTFSETYPDIFALTRNAWDMDRRLLVALDQERWSRAVRDVKRALTDEVIAAAVARMPPEHVAIVGRSMTDALIARRDRLDEAAAELYRVVFSVADVQGTDAGEELRVTRGLDDRVTLTVTPLGGGVPTYRRTFESSETSEIRIYMQGGDDVVVLEGGGADDVLVRVVGGGGSDTFRDESWRPQSQTTLYDGGARTTFPTLGSAKVRRMSPVRPLSWFELDRDLDWGTLTVPQPTASYDGDRGLVLSPGLKHDRYGFMKQPYSERLQVQAGWSLGLHEPIIDYRHLGRRVVGPLDLRLRFRWSGIEIINFYGFGNETATSRPIEYHRVAHKQVTARVQVSLGDGERRYFEMGPSFTYTSTDTTVADSFIAEADPYGSGKFTHAGVRTSFGIDTRDHLGTPSRGIRIEGGAGAFPTMFDATAGFAEVHGEVATYLSPPGANPVLALRAMGKRVWGAPPFTESAFLGGPRTVRSLREQRYAGDAMLLGSAELRLKIGRLVFPVPADVGVFALGDAGRVYVDGEASGSWHTAVGGGIWFALVNRSNLVRVALARGDDRTAITAGVGFAF
jgi:hypothetical protein